MSIESNIKSLAESSRRIADALEAIADVLPTMVGGPPRHPVGAPADTDAMFADVPSVMADAGQDVADASRTDPTSDYDPLEVDAELRDIARRVDNGVELIRGILGKHQVAGLTQATPEQVHSVITEARSLVQQVEGAV